MDKSPHPSPSLNGWKTFTNRRKTLFMILTRVPSGCRLSLCAGKSVSDWRLPCQEEAPRSKCLNAILKTAPHPLHNHNWRSLMRSPIAVLFFPNLLYLVGFLHALHRRGTHGLSNIGSPNVHVSKQQSVLTTSLLVAYETAVQQYSSRFG